MHFNVLTLASSLAMKKRRQHGVTAIQSRYFVCHEHWQNLWLLGHRGLADIDAELEELSVNAGSTPERVGRAHVPDQSPNFDGHLRSANSSCSRLPAPERAKAGAMPADNRLRLNDSHRISRGLKEPGAADVLQSDDASEELVARFRVWHAWTLDLPGSYNLQVFEDLFRRNKLARGEFQALGRPVDLSNIRAPLFLIASARDEVTPSEQLMDAKHLVGTRRSQISMTLARGSHLSLFMGCPYR